ERHGRQQSHDHPSTQRIVAERAGLATGEHHSCVAERCTRPADEVGKSCMLGSDPAPYESHCNDGERGIAEPLVPPTGAVTREPRGQYTGHKEPVTDAHERVPDPDRARGAGIVSIHSCFVGTGASVFGWKYASTRSPFSFS